MKQTAKITVCAVSAALAAALMLVSYFPYLTYAIPAVAGLFMMIPLITADCKWAFCAYIVSAVIVLFTAEPEAKFLYVFLLGYYPIVKALIERIKKPFVEWLIKILIYNAAIVIFYKTAAFVIGADFTDFGDLGKYGVYIFWAFSNIVFVLYDIAVSRMAVLYIYRIHPQIKKLFKI